MDFNNFQFGEENLRWLSLLPLFETDHWPVYRRGYPFDNNTTEDFLMQCICGDHSHNTVCVFPYARYGYRGAWNVMEETMIELQEHYADEEYERLEDAEYRVTSSWPWFFAQIFEQSWNFYPELCCRDLMHGDWDGCDNSPFMYPFWAPDEAEYVRCHCTGDRVEESEMEDSSLDEILIHRIREHLVLEDGSSFDFGTHGEGRKGFTLSEFNPWVYEVVGGPYEEDEPPSYESVSELPSYEQAIVQMEEELAKPLHGSSKRLKIQM